MPSAVWLSFVPESDRWFVSLIIVFALAFTVSELFRRYKMSEMVGEILTGVILSIPVIKNGLLTDQSIAAIGHIGEIAAMLLLALAGLELEIEKVREASKDAVIISFAGFWACFALVFAYVMKLGYSWQAAFVVGVMVSAAAEELTTKVYLELGIVNTKIGATTIMAAVVDDVMEVLGVTMAIALIISGSMRVLYTTFPAHVALFIIIMFASSYGIGRLLRWYRGEPPSIFWLYLALLLGASALGAALELGPAIGAILGGFFIQLGIRRVFRSASKEEKEKITKSYQDVVETLERVLMGFLIPFFFIEVGINFDIAYLYEYPIMVLIMTLIGLWSKIIGIMAVKPATKLKWRQHWFIGWGMSARGTLGMYLALLALQHHLISSELYTSIIAMAMITTIVFPFMLRIEYNRGPNIVN